MGGERNGTAAYAKGAAYPSSDHYGRVYMMRGGQPEHVVVMFYNIAPGIDTLDRVDISMGLALNTLNIITMRNVPISGLTQTRPSGTLSAKIGERKR